MGIRGLYKENSVNFIRTETDKMFIDENSENRFNGIVDETYNFVQGFQLLDEEEWVRFVDQFRLLSDTDYGWRGEYWGKMMRGACFVYSYTKNQKLYDILTKTVKDMLSTMDDLGRISSYPVFLELDGWDIWSRKYVLLGLQYFMEICTDEQMNDKIVASMIKQVDYLISKIGDEENKTPITKTSNFWRGVNSSSILEPIVRLYVLTNEQRFLDFATYIVSSGGAEIANIFELAYEDKTDPYQYPVVKAYETISCFEGLLEYYRVTKEEKWKTAVINFAKRLSKTDITIIGTAGCAHEYFDHSALRQTDPKLQGIMQETCVTVTWMKFCLQLLMITGQSEFADLFEQSFYNAYLGAVNTEKVIDQHVLANYPDTVLRAMPFDSYSSLVPNTRGRGVGGLKVMPDNYYYGCCACIGAAGIGMVHKIATMVKETGIAVNLYIDGTVKTVTPKNNPVVFNFKTEYPKNSTVDITLELKENEEFELSFRVPDWSEHTNIAVNGEKVNAKKGYTDIKRLFKNGDKISLTFDMRTKVILPIKYDKDVVMLGIHWEQNYFTPQVVYQSPESLFHIALKRGPIILARDARLDGTVDEAVLVDYDENGIVELDSSNKATFKTILEYQVPTKTGKTFTVIDYASAGKTYREDSRYACWLPTKKYW